MAPRWFRGTGSAGARESGTGSAGPQRSGQSWLSGTVLVSISVAALLVVAGLTLVSERADDGPQPSAAARNNRCWRTKPTERRFQRKMNKARSRGNRGRLRFDPELSKVARKHTGEMVRRGTLYHTSAGQLRQRVVKWQLLGENVGVGGAVRSLHRAFMHSPGHRANVLRSSFNHSGVGVRKAGGRMWVTVIFQASTNPGTRLRMPRC
jgi:uncharacterized protein YkwD